MDDTDLFVKFGMLSSLLTELESCGSHMTSTHSDHASTSESFLFSNSRKSAFEEIGDDNAILPSRDVGVACQFDCQQAISRIGL
jgi:hypothetical protein